MGANVLVDWLRDGEPAPPAPEAASDRWPLLRRPWALAAAGGLWLGLIVTVWQWSGSAADPAAVEPPAAPKPPVEAPRPAAEPAAEHAQLLRAVEAQAVLAVRTDVSVGQGPRQRYVDLAVAESVRWVGDTAVVGVLAYLLEGDETRWSAARPARFAVAVSAADHQPVVLGSPWALPARTRDAAAPGWTPLPELALVEAARAALSAAGYGDITALELSTSVRVPGVLRATVTATAPGDTASDHHEVWLDDTADAVLGWGG